MLLHIRHAHLYYIITRSEYFYTSVFYTGMERHYIMNRFLCVFNKTPEESKWRNVDQRVASPAGCPRSELVDETSPDDRQENLALVVVPAGYIHTAESRNDARKRSRDMPRFVCVYTIVACRRLVFSLSTHFQPMYIYIILHASEREREIGKAERERERAHTSILYRAHCDQAADKRENYYFFSSQYTIA